LEVINLDVFVLIPLARDTFIYLLTGSGRILSTIHFAIKNYNTRYQNSSMIKQLKIIRNKKQYYEYCNILEDLVMSNRKKDLDDIELLTLLIKKWDDDNLPKINSDPIQLIKALMEENNLKAIDIADILKVNKSTISRILSYQKGLSKKSIRVLSSYFSISQEALNQPYKLKNEINKKFKNASLMNTVKKMESAGQLR